MPFPRNIFTSNILLGHNISPYRKGHKDYMHGYQTYVLRTLYDIVQHLGYSNDHMDTTVRMLIPCMA